MLFFVCWKFAECFCALVAVFCCWFSLFVPIHKQFRSNGFEEKKKVNNEYPHAHTHTIISMSERNFIVISFFFSTFSVCCVCFMRSFRCARHIVFDNDTSCVLCNCNEIMWIVCTLRTALSDQPANWLLCIDEMTKRKHVPPKTSHYNAWNLCFLRLCQF